MCAGVRVHVFESLSVCACKSVTMRARVCECVRAREGEYASVSVYVCVCVRVCARALLEALLGDALPVQARVPAARASHLFLPLQSHCYQSVEMLSGSVLWGRLLSTWYQ